MKTATLSVSLRFNGEPSPGGSFIATFRSGHRRSFLDAIERATPHGHGWGARYTIAAEEAQKLGAELTGPSDAMIHLSLSDHIRYPRLGQAIEVSLFRIPADPFAAFQNAADEVRS